MTCWAAQDPKDCRDVEVDDPPPIMKEDQEAEQDLGRWRWGS